MAYNAPPDFQGGELVTDFTLNTYVRDNLTEIYNLTGDKPYVSWQSSGAIQQANGATGLLDLHTFSGFTTRGNDLLFVIRTQHQGGSVVYSYTGTTTRIGSRIVSTTRTEVTEGRTETVVESVGYNEAGQRAADRASQLSGTINQLRSEAERLGGNTRIGTGGDRVLTINDVLARLLNEQAYQRRVAGQNLNVVTRQRTAAGSTRTYTESTQEQVTITENFTRQDTIEFGELSVHAQIDSGTIYRVALNTDEYNNDSYILSGIPAGAHTIQLFYSTDQNGQSGDVSTDRFEINSVSVQIKELGSYV